MKFINISTVTIVGLLSFPVLSAVELIADNSLELLVVNGEKAKTQSSMFSSKQSITLPDGEQQIVFQYSYAFKRGDKQNRVESDVIIAKFSATDTVLAFEFPKYRNVREAENKISQLDWSLIDKSTQKAVVHKEDRLTTQGMQIGRNYVRETQDYNRLAGPASIVDTVQTSSTVTSPNTSPVAVASATAAATTVTTPVAATTAVVGTAASKTTIQAESVTPISEVEKETAEEMLLFWYEKASPEAKQRFKALINSQ